MPKPKKDLNSTPVISDAYAERIDRLVDDFLCFSQVVNQKMRKELLKYCTS